MALKFNACGIQRKHITHFDQSIFCVVVQLKMQVVNPFVRRHIKVGTGRSPYKK